jgi:uncharacterized OB-fold protein
MPNRKPSSYTDMIHLITPSKLFNVLSLDPYVAEFRLVMPYRYFPGPTATRFFVELQDNQRIMGIKCGTCGIVYVPPETICGRCFEKLHEWVEVGKQGVLQTYTISHYTLPVHRNQAPIIYGIIKLDGADTGFLHLLGEVEVGALHIGMRMEAVFMEDRAGNILAIKYFRPVNSSGFPSHDLSVF